MFITTMTIIPHNSTPVNKILYMPKFYISPGKSIKPSYISLSSLSSIILVLCPIIRTQKRTRHLHARFFLFTVSIFYSSTLLIVGLYVFSCNHGKVALIQTANSTRITIIRAIAFKMILTTLFPI